MIRARDVIKIPSKLRQNASRCTGHMVSHQPFNSARGFLNLRPHFFPVPHCLRSIPFFPSPPALGPGSYCGMTVESSMQYPLR